MLLKKSWVVFLRWLNTLRIALVLCRLLCLLVIGFICWLVCFEALLGQAHSILWTWVNLVQLLWCDFPDDSLQGSAYCESLFSGCWEHSDGCSRGCAAAACGSHCSHLCRDRESLRLPADPLSTFSLFTPLYTPLFQYYIL